MSSATEQILINAAIILLIIASYILGIRAGKHVEKKIKNNEPTPKSYWNYRVATRLVKHVLKDEFWREYLIIECHYTDGKPRAYGESVKMNAFEELSDLMNTNILIATSFEKGVLNLDDFPNEFNLDDLQNDFKG